MSMRLIFCLTCALYVLRSAARVERRTLANNEHDGKHLDVQQPRVDDTAIANNAYEQSPQLILDSYRTRFEKHSTDHHGLGAVEDVEEEITMAQNTSTAPEAIESDATIEDNECQDPTFSIPATPNYNQPVQRGQRRHASDPWPESGRST